MVYRVRKKITAIIGWGLYLKNKNNLEEKQYPFLSRSWIYLYNGERIGMIDKGVPEICLFYSDKIICKGKKMNAPVSFGWHKNISVRIPTNPGSIRW